MATKEKNDMFSFNAKDAFGGASTEDLNKHSHISVDLRALASEMDTLIPDADNARKHDSRNLKVIAESLKRFGQRTPIVVNRKNKVILKGNGTYTAAKMLGWKQIAVVWVDDLVRLVEIGCMGKLCRI